VIHQFPPLGFDPRRDSIYDKSLTGEPILPSQTADQYLARYWFAVRDGKIGSPVRDLSAELGLLRNDRGTYDEALKNHKLAIEGTASEMAGFVKTNAQFQSNV
jgi:hypothetical protein